MSVHVDMVGIPLPARMSEICNEIRATENTFRSIKPLTFIMKFAFMHSPTCFLHYKKQ